MAEIKITRQEIISLCRLCLGKDLVSIDIFEAGSELRHLYTKIVACLPVQVFATDTLPHKICEVCNAKVDDFYQFWTCTAKNQKQLNDWLQIATDQITDAPTIKVEAEDTSKNDEFDDYDDGARGDDSEDEDEEASVPKRIKTQHSDDEDTKPTELISSMVDESSEISDQKEGNRKRSKEIQPKKNLARKKRTNKAYMAELLKTLDIERKDLKKRRLVKVKTESESQADENGVHSCDQCDFTTTNKKTLGSHVLRRHVGYTVFCKECNVGFYSSTHLHSHGIKVHGLPAFICEHCSKPFTSKGNLTVHVKYYHAKTFFECSVCLKSFNFKTSYKRHLKQHDDSVTYYPCTVCNKNLSSPYRLKTHMLIHANNRVFTCEVCGKGFIQKRYLEEHNRVHTGYKPYACDICSKQFTQKSTLNIHRKLHLNIKDFICDLCGAKFVSKAFLSYHFRKRHQQL